MRDDEIIVDNIDREVKKLNGLLGEASKAGIRIDLEIHDAVYVELLGGGNCFQGGLKYTALRRIGSNYS